MRVLVTGGSGFTGGAVVRALHGQGHDVVALARSASSADKLRALGCEPVWGDLDDAQSIDSAFSAAEADCLINIASLGFGHAPTIVAAAQNADLFRAVFVSTTAIFTKLPAPSKEVRTAAEQSIMASGLEWTIIRPTMIYGAPGDRNISRLVRLLQRVPVLPIPGEGARLQQPVHVDDLARSIVTAAERDAAVHVAYDVAGPEAISFRDLLVQSCEAAGRKPRLISVPMGVARRLVGWLERIGQNPRLKVEQLDRLEEDKAFDISAAVRDLDFRPRPFRDGVQELVALLKQQDSAKSGLGESL